MTCVQFRLETWQVLMKSYFIWLAFGIHEKKHDSSLGVGVIGQNHTHVCLCLLQNVSWWQWQAAWTPLPQSGPQPPAAQPQTPPGFCPRRSAVLGNSTCWSRSPPLGWSEQRTGRTDGWQRRVWKGNTFFRYRLSVTQGDKRKTS